jgi:hypothetical protein
MPVIKTGVNPAHDAALIAAEQAHQAAIVGATAAQIRAADLAFLRACKSSCITNNNSAGVEQFNTAIRELLGTST